MSCPVILNLNNVVRSLFRNMGCLKVRNSAWSYWYTLKGILWFFSCNIYYSECYLVTKVKKRIAYSARDTAHVPFQLSCSHTTYKTQTQIVQKYFFQGYRYRCVYVSFKVYLFCIVFTSLFWYTTNLYVVYALN